MMGGSKLWFITALFSIVLVAGSARAQDDDEAGRARTEFVRGMELVKKTQWAEALVAFEAADKIRPHAVTTYNIGVCQRALGRYALARATFTRALLQSDGAPDSAKLSETLAT